MIFTLYYIYATFLQWYRLGALKNKLKGTLSTQNALLVVSGLNISDPKHHRCLETLLFSRDNRIGCTVVPKQKINLNQWVQFPKSEKYFPIHIISSSLDLGLQKSYVLLSAQLDKYVPHDGDIIQVENFGEPVAWRISDGFEVIIKTDDDYLTKLVHYFINHDLDINHELKLLRLETVDVEGTPTKIKYEKKYTIDQQLKYSYSPVYWKKFVKDINTIFSRISESSNPKITIENGNKSDDGTKKPMSEVKPIRGKVGKEEKHKAEKKNTLEVQSRSKPKVKEDKDKHKSEQKDKHKEDHKHKDGELKSKTEHKHKDGEVKSKESEHKHKDGKEAKHKDDQKQKDGKEVKHKEKDGDVKHKDGVDGKPKDVEVADVKPKDVDVKHEKHKTSDKRKDVDGKQKEEKDGDVKHKDVNGGIKDIDTHKSKSKDKEKHSHSSESSIKTNKESLARSSSKIEVKVEDTSKKTGSASKIEIPTICEPSTSSSSSSKPEKKVHKSSSQSEKITKETKKSDYKSTKETNVKTSPSKDKSPDKDKAKSKDVKTKDEKDEKKKSLFGVGRSKEKKVKKDDKKKREDSKDSSDAEKKRLTYAETAKLDVKDCLRAVSPSSSNSSRENTSDDLKKTSMSNGSAHKMKPPNVLVYADSIVAKDNVKSVLSKILNKDMYTIYDMPTSVNTESEWCSSTGLVIVCGSVPPPLSNQLIEYLINGGQLLCLCSDLLHTVLQTFTTAEVREHELVRFSYGNWKRVKMMHHIFCYQASPARKQFSKDSDQSSNSDGNSPIAPRTPSTVDVHHDGKNYTIHVQVLGTEETWQTPSLLLATVRNSTGRAVFSQVHLEIDPLQYEDDESKFAALKDSNDARIEILKDILSKYLSMDCNNMNTNNDYSPGYFLGRYDLKLDMLQNCPNIVSNKLESNGISVEFCGKGSNPEEATPTKFPIMIHACPSNFSTVKYFEALETEQVGRLVLYADVMTSSQNILEKKLRHGLVVIPRQQTEGVGRSKNTWLSPPGCAMFSLQLHIPLQSPFGQHLPLIQHFVMAAVVSAIRKKQGYENIDVKIKWPNDLYAYSSVKIGGLVVKTFMDTNEAVVNIGCGINLDNRSPTDCINAMIEKYNLQNNTSLELLPYEVFLAMVFNEIENIFSIVQNGNMSYFYELYEKHWLHTDAEITIVNKDNVSQKVKIIGIDEYGFLKVQSLDGNTISSVQPDGNSFDMLKGLIAPKIF